MNWFIRVKNYQVEIMVLFRPQGAWIEEQAWCRKRTRALVCAVEGPTLRTVWGDHSSHLHILRKQCRSVMPGKTVNRDPAPSVGYHLLVVCSCFGQTVRSRGIRGPMADMIRLVGRKACRRKMRPWVVAESTKITVKAIYNYYRFHRPVFGTCFRCWLNCFWWIKKVSNWHLSFGNTAYFVWCLAVWSVCFSKPKKWFFRQSDASFTRLSATNKSLKHS